MPVLIRYTLSSLSREHYDKVNEALQAQGADAPPEDLLLHVLFGDEPAMRVSEIWSSEEVWRGFFDGPLATAFGEAGMEMPSTEVLEVHEIWGSMVKED